MFSDRVGKKRTTFPTPRGVVSVARHFHLASTAGNQTTHVSLPPPPHPTDGGDGLRRLEMWGREFCVCDIEGTAYLGDLLVGPM